MLILLLLMALALAAGCWAYSYVWRGLNRRVIAAVKVVDPMITLGPVTNELPEEFYFKSNIMVTNRHESSSRASGEAH